MGVKNVDIATKEYCDGMIIVKDYSCGSVSIASGNTYSNKQALSQFDIEGYTRMAWTPYTTLQNYATIGLSFIDSNVYINVRNNYSSALTFQIRLSIAYVRTV